MNEKAIQPEVVSCQIGHKDMEVRVLGARAAYRREVVPRYEFWLPPFGGCAVYYWDRPNRGYAEPTSGLEPLSCSLLVCCSIAKDAGCVSFQSAL